MSHDSHTAYPPKQPLDSALTHATGATNRPLRTIPPGSSRHPATDVLLGYSPRKMPLRERLAMARARLRHAAENGIRIRVYEVALDLDMSEFHFARQFRSAYGYSPHVYYDEVRAARGRDLLRQGVNAGVVARRIGLRRPAELRALLQRRQQMQSMLDVEPASVIFPSPLLAEQG